MGLPHHIQEVVDGFLAVCGRKVRPGVCEYLTEVGATATPDLIAALIDVDFDRRCADGDVPQMDDYDALGPFAVDYVTDLLERNGYSVDGTEVTRTVSSVDVSMTRTKLSSKDATACDNGDTAPARIGPYSLVRQIGKGGMGSVWLAKQEEPVRRTVAIKLIRADIDPEGAIARFDAERAAIAMMDHPNIARILDAGKTDDGTPYFVMEMVEGIRFDKYCDKHRLGIRDRLQLMVPVCRAVQHAHQKGIVHRDLKDSNILISESDGKAVPKVIDFGLAKALEQRHIHQESMLTGVGEVVGTLRYMSPEQAQGEAIDTRTDIYSLGVVIYKLLTGTTPLQRSTLNTNSFVKILSTIREVDPERPSVRLQGLPPERIEKICQDRNEKPEKLKQILRGDLDWIVLKALEKEPSRRYETANGVAREIERYLNDEEVAARPPSSWYRIEKFVKRNRGFVTTLAVFLCMLIFGVMGTTAALFWALDERDRANTNAVAAREQSVAAMKAERQARESEGRRRKLQTKAEAQLHAIRMKSAWSDWQMGNAEPAWKMLNSISGEQGWEARFLRSEFTSSKHVLFGHALAIMAMDVSPDGRLIATASADRTVRLWDARTRAFLSRRILPGTATDICFSSDGKWLACSDRSNHVSLWQVTGGDDARVFGPFPRDISSVAFCGNKKLVIGDAGTDSYKEGLTWKERNAGDPLVRILDIETGNETETLTGHTKTIMGLACSADAKTIVSGAYDATVRIWRKEGSGWVPQVLTNHMLAVLDVAISPSGKALATCGRDKTIRLWNLETGELTNTIVGHTAAVNGVQFSADETEVVSCSSDRSARIWDLAGKELLACRGHYDAVNVVRFLPGSREVVTGSDDYTARVWNAKATRGAVVRQAHTELVWGAAFSPDGKTLVTVSEDGSIVRTDAETGRELSKSVEEQAVLAVAWSPSGEHFVTAGEDTALTIRSGSDGKPIRQIPDAHTDLIWDLDISPDGKLLASSSSDKTVKIWRTADWTCIRTLTEHRGELASARFSRDGTYLVTASDDKKVNLWDARSFELLHTFTGHSNAIWRAVFSPDGRLIASSSYNGEIIIWDVAARRQVRVIEAHTNQVAGLAFVPDGSRLVSASDDRTIKIWDLESGIDFFVLRDHGDSPSICVAFSKDGSRLASGDSSGWVTIRSAAPAGEQPQPFLPEEAIVLATDGMHAVVAKDASETALRDELAKATKCCEHYPSFQTWTNRGVAEFRLNKLKESIESMQEAARLEPIQYGEPDVKPFIEGYLAMAYHLTGQKDAARTTRALFEKKRVASLWLKDDETLTLAAQVKELMGPYTSN